MSANDTLFQSPYLITSRKFPKDPEALEPVLTKSFNDIAFNVNASTSGIYDKLQIVTRNRYFNDNDQNRQRQSYRQVYTLDALPNAGAAMVVGGLNLQPTSAFVHIYGTANNTNVRSVPIPFVNVATPTDGIQLEYDWVGNQIIVTTTTANWIAYSAIIVLEYILA